MEGTDDTTADAPEPWWKKAPQGPPPKWASPAAARRMRLKQIVLPSRLTARAEANAAADGATKETAAAPEP